MGGFSIPFETIYNVGRIEGVFRIDTPVVNFGYDHVPSGVTATTRADGSMFVDPDNPDDGDQSPRPGGSGSPVARNAVYENTMWGWMLRLFDLATSVGMALTTKRPLGDSLYFSGSHIHRKSQVALLLLYDIYIK